MAPKVPAPTAADKECDAYSPPAKAAAGTLDRARLVREWPDVIDKVRAGSQPIAHMLAGTVPDIDGDDLVVEFPADESIQAELVGEHDNMRLLRDAVAEVFGAAFAVRTQLGRGSIKPATRPVDQGRPEVPQREEPADGLEGESPSSVARAPREGAKTTDIEAMLRDELGAQLVSEHPADEKDR